LLLPTAVDSLSAPAPKTYGFDASASYCAPEIPAVVLDEQTTRSSIGILGAVYFEDLLNTWPTRRIPYFIDKTVAAKKDLADAVRAAADHINKRTIVRLVEMSEANAKKQKGWVRVVDSTVTYAGKSRECASSNAGFAEREQLVWVGRATGVLCNENGGPSIAHEFLHVIGLHHEHEHKLRDLHGRLAL
jgi:hypothetical protein